MLWHLVGTKMKKILREGLHCILLVATARYATLLFINLGQFNIRIFSSSLEVKYLYHH